MKHRLTWIKIFMVHVFSLIVEWSKRKKLMLVHDHDDSGWHKIDALHIFPIHYYYIMTYESWAFINRECPHTQIRTLFGFVNPHGKLDSP